jgi:pimeloyl-ACP methyl ester carboxylesterase
VTVKRSGVVLVVSLLTASIAGAQQPGDRFVGLWQGALSVSTIRLRLAFEFKRDSSGALTGVMTSIDQGGAKVPGKVTLAGDTLVMTMGAIARYRATVDASGDSLHGTFTQNVDFPLDLGRTSAIAAMHRPQEPKPPFPYRTEDVTVESVGGVRLGCTLNIPQGKGPFPAAVMATGSGPQDRDEALLGHRPFLVLADYLARQGIATLRCDDRGVARSTGNYATATPGDFSNDAAAGVRYLHARAEVAPNRIGVIGHSEGGMVGPMLAARSNDIAFVVMMAGPGIRGDSLLILQGYLIGKAAGAPPRVLTQQRIAQQALFEAVIGAHDSADAEVRVRKAEEALVASLPDSEQAFARRQLAQGHAQIMSRELQEIVKYDPGPILSKVHVPVLAINGTLDLQVPYAEDLAGVASALKAGGDRDVTTVALPGLNHLFQTAKTGAPSEYAEIEQTMAPVALETIANWINARFGVK